MIIHIVKEGEDINGIAAFYGVDAESLALINGVAPFSPLPVGMAVLVLIPVETHTVTEGDTLYSVAQLYGVSVNTILRNNPSVGALAPLTIGQTLVIRFRGDPMGSLITNAYAYPFIEDGLLREVLPFLTRLIPFTYGFRPDGTLIAPDDDRMIALANTYGVEPAMHLSTLTDEGRFDSGAAARLLADPALKRTVAENVLVNMLSKGYTVLDVDFEYIPPEFARSYYEFILLLTELLSPYGYEVITALAPKTYAEQPGLLYEAHDYALIGAASDAVFLMTYEWGYSAGPPMAVAPISNVRRVLDYAVSVIPREKIYLGIPIYGYDWTLPYSPGNPPAPSISPEDAIALAQMYGSVIQYSFFSEAPYFYYYAPDGSTHEVWFEDARSMRAKLSLAAEYGLKGVGFWQAGRRFSQGWHTLSAMFDIPQLN